MYEGYGIIRAWHRIFGMISMGTQSACDLQFYRDHKEIVLGMMVSYKAVTGNASTSIFKRLKTVYPGAWYLCEIMHFQNAAGNWKYRMLIEYDGPIPLEPVIYEMNAPSGRIPAMFLRHPMLGGRYTLENDMDFDIDIIN